MTKTQHPLYNKWWAMHLRCNYPNHISYPNYGGRGITICDRWNDFWLFVEDIGECPGPGYTLDRIDNHGNYTPDNCEWSTWEQQNNNRRSRKPTADPSNDMRYIVEQDGRYLIRVTIRPKERVQKGRTTLSEAKELRAIFEYERDFYRYVGVG